MKFVEMPTELQTKSIETLSLNYGMPEQIIEKDWWVSAVMRALFALPYPAATSQSHPTLKNAKVSTLLLRNSTEEERKQGLELDDYLIRFPVSRVLRLEDYL